MTQVKTLKRQHLGIVVAEPLDLPIGSQGEFITADTLKPYLDEIATKATPAQIATAVNALETKILGGAGLDADTLAELNSKVVALQNLTDADKTGILDLLALKVNTTDIMPIVNAKADEESVASRLATKADESSVASRLATKATETSVTERLATKADETSVASRLAEKASETSVASRLAEKASETSVATRLADKASLEQLSIVETIAANAVTNEILGLALADKITAAQAETIAQAISTALENKIMGGVGTDADTMAELKALLDNLQSLSEGDVNGVMQLVSEKIAKSDIYNSVVYPEGLDSNTVGATLASFVTATNLSSDKVISSTLLNLLIKDLIAGLGQTAAAQSQALATFNNTLNEKLDTSVFDTYFKDGRTGGKILEGLVQVEAEDYVINSMIGNQQNLSDTTISEDLTGSNQLKVVLSSDAHGSLKAMNFSAYLSFLANHAQSPIAQKLAEKLTKAEFEQLFQLLAQEVPYSNPNGTTINAQVTTQKKIAFDNDIAIKKLVVGDMQLDSLVGIGYDENGNYINPKNLSATQINNDLPDEGGDGFLHIMVVDAEEGIIKRISPMQLMNVIAMNVNSPVNQMIADRDLIISALTARVQALEDLFETQPA